MFVGGGSIGHIAPSVAVARELMREIPDARAHFVVGLRPEDAAFVQQAGFPFSQIPAPRLSLSFPWKFLQAFRAASKILKNLKPAVVFCKGGYVSVPVAFAARIRSIPIVLHESDVVSGWANRLVSRSADTVCLGYEGSIRHPRALFTGTPVRDDLAGGSRQKGLALTGLGRFRPILLVLGGSQGALALNRAVARNLTGMLDLCSIIHLTGEGKAVVAQNPPGYWQCSFASEEYPHLLAAADLCLSRAGATSIADLAAAGLPAILVPLTGVAHDHQAANARMAAESGGCVVLPELNLDAELLPMLRTFLDPERRALMQKAIRALEKPESARQIAGVIARLLARDGRRA